MKLILTHTFQCTFILLRGTMRISNFQYSNKHICTIIVNDFRCISIWPVIFKLFEHCIGDRFSTFLASSDHQFGFKKGSSCSHAIHIIKTIVGYYNQGGSMVHLCALDLSKAFDKMDHNDLFVKSMERKLPVELLCIIENWF